MAFIKKISIIFHDITRAVPFAKMLLEIIVPLPVLAAGLRKVVTEQSLLQLMILKNNCT